MKKDKTNKEALALQATLDSLIPSLRIDMEDSTGAKYSCNSMSQALRNINSVQKSLAIEMLPNGWEQMPVSYVFAHMLYSPIVCKKFKITIYTKLITNKTKLK